MEFYVRWLIIESSDMSNTNKALAVLHNSELLSMTPSSFNSYDTELHERGAFPHYATNDVLFQHQTQTVHRSKLQHSGCIKQSDFSKRS